MGELSLRSPLESFVEHSARKKKKTNTDYSVLYMYICVQIITNMPGVPDQRSRSHFRGSYMYMYFST